VFFDQGAAGEDLEFEFVVVGHAASVEGVFDRLFAVEDLVDAFFAGDALGMVAVLVEGDVELGDGGDFGEAEAEVVVLAIHECGVEAADLVVDAGVHETEVEDHEVGEELVFVVGDLAVAAVGLDGAVGVDRHVIGVDEADVGMIF
jgi:hypothetical protein